MVGYATSDATVEQKDLASTFVGVSGVVTNFKLEFNEPVPFIPYDTSVVARLYVNGVEKTSHTFSVGERVFETNSLSIPITNSDTVGIGLKLDSRANFCWSEFESVHKAIVIVDVA